MVGCGMGAVLVRVLGYAELLSLLRRGFRNGNWRRLRLDDKAMFSAAVWYAKVKGRIINPRVLAQLLSVIERLKATVRTHILRSGRDKAEEMLNQYKNRGILEWLPRLKAWLNDLNYIFWLGTMQNSLQGFYPMVSAG